MSNKFLSSKLSCLAIIASAIAACNSGTATSSLPTPAPSPTPTTPAGPTMAWVVDNSFTPNNLNKLVWHYAVNPDGTITDLPESVPAPGFVTAFDPSGVAESNNILYIVDNYNAQGNGAIYEYHLDENGNASYIESAPLPNGLDSTTNPWYPDNIVINGKYAYVSSAPSPIDTNGPYGNTSYGIYKYTIGNDGLLESGIESQPIPQTEFINTTTNYGMWAIAINNGYLYLTTSGNIGNLSPTYPIYKFTIDSNGDLSNPESQPLPATGSQAGGYSLNSITFIDNNAYVTVGNANPATIYQYSANTADGSLNFQGTTYVTIPCGSYGGCYGNISAIDHNLWLGILSNSSNEYGVNYTVDSNGIPTLTTNFLPVDLTTTTYPVVPMATATK